MTALISVNITTYNRAHLLPRCLESVLAQSYKHIEVIVVDDCSTDETEAVVKNYRQSDRRIKYIRHNENRGNAAARNSALMSGSGVYVAFMDDDDEWIDLEKLKKQVSVFESWGHSSLLGIVCSDVLIYRDKGSCFEKKITKPNDLRTHILMGNSIIYNSTVMTMRKVVMEAGGFDESLPRGIDSDFYRACIVNLNYEVEFMKGTTVAVHEYGDDRITLKKSVASIERESEAIVKGVLKYKKHFDGCRKAKLFRRKQLIKNSLKLAILKRSLREILKIPGYLLL